MSEKKSIYGLFSDSSATPLHTWEANSLAGSGRDLSLYINNDDDSISLVAAITLKDGQHVARLDCVKDNPNLPSESRLGPILRK